MFFLCIDAKILFAIRFAIFAGIVCTENPASPSGAQRIILILMMVSDIVMTLFVVYMSLNLMNWD